MEFSNKLITWYKKNGRDLPWRQTSDPYCIWLSEVILQQTRVDQGTAYYHRFVEAFPSVAHLAQASEQEVLKLWQGLGYYSRARNLHKAAQLVFTKFKGVFPSDYASLRQLPGVGDYTAAAVASIASREPVAVVDGNVYRVLARVFNESTPVDSPTGKRLFAQLAQELLNTRRPDLHNQAMMELGALVCTPRNASCAVCPVRENCLALAKNTIYHLPVKRQKVKVLAQQMYYAAVVSNNQVFVQQRTEPGIWQNLYDFPHETELTEEASPQRAYTKLFNSLGIAQTPPSPEGPFRHLLSHRQLNAWFVRVEIAETHVLAAKGKWVPFGELHTLPIPRLIHKVLQQWQWLS